MGASGWIYSVPYQENLEQAFQAVRQEVFESNRYHNFREMLEYENAKEALCEEHGVNPRNEEAVGHLLQEFGPIHITRAQTIEEYLQKPDDGQGTHSILDLTHFSTSYKGIALSQDLLEQLFADQRPDRKIVEAIVLQDTIWSRVRGWIQVNLSCRASEPRLPPLFEFSEEVLQFLTSEQSLQELVEAFLGEEQMWMALYPCICFEVRWLIHASLLGTMWPFPSEKMMPFFGTQQPTKEVVKEALAQNVEIWSLLRRWMGYYIIVYERELPSEIVFIGCSGD